MNHFDTISKCLGWLQGNDPNGLWNDADEVSDLCLYELQVIIDDMMDGESGLFGESCQ